MNENVNLPGNGTQYTKNMNPYATGTPAYPAQGPNSYAPSGYPPVYPQNPVQQVPVPAAVRRPKIPFSATAGEKTAAFLMLILSYVYTLFAFPSDIRSQKWWLFGFTLGFLAVTELVLFHKKRSPESFVWLFCVLATLGGITFGGNRVWEDLSWIFLHGFAGWYVITRAGAQLEGESGSLFPMDSVNAFFTFPFKNFILQVRVMIAAFRGQDREKREGEKKRSGAVLYTLLAVTAGIILFVIAVNLLMDADDGFAKAAGKVLDIFRIEAIPEIIGRLFFAVPIGMYLFGMIAGDGRERKERLAASSGRIRHAFSLLHKVPNLAYCIILGIFCVFYLLFFIMQGSYLFGAFSGKLPDGFIVSQYARQGFFELCRVMTLNFVLLWLVTQTGRKTVRTEKWTRILSVLLLVESILFAAVAFSKLALYISSFGFTPLRLQSSWLVCVLFFGCLCALYSVIWGKKSFRAFLIFAGATLSILCIY